MNKIVLIFLFSKIPFIVISQCLNQDFHTAGLNESWVSCNESINPFVNRGSGHWIYFDLDRLQKIKSLKIWNISHPEYLDYGVKKIRLEASKDGTNWELVGDLFVEQGSSSIDYLGENIDIAEFNAKYVLMTLLENYGGKCLGLSEVKFNIGNTTANDEIDIAQNIIVSPNPFSDVLTVDIKDLNPRSLSYELYNSEGRILEKRKIDQQSNDGSFEISGTSLISGTYFLKVITDELVSTKKLLVVHPK